MEISQWKVWRDERLDSTIFESPSRIAKVAAAAIGDVTGKSLVQIKAIEPIVLQFLFCCFPPFGVDYGPVSGGVAGCGLVLATSKRRPLASSLQD
ncbi:hypothetical protein TorRG33x02_120980 [Trema orientale]|uniref:Uncharacterized protein n=1 Tax=Trema orientale TaxID=63057 RepID=A0A2P5F2L5_TREOI|nr:hypothetical protein TorRG33x02_120980 [Trema orientale]